VLSNVEGVIVDLDGTMIDTLGDFTAALNAMLADLQLRAVAPAQTEALVGKGSEHLIRGVLGLQCTPAQTDALYPRAWQRYQAHYLAINGQFSQVYPGVEGGLAGLKASGLRLACLTNKPLAFTTPLLKAKGLDGFFPTVFGGDSFAQKKPHPLPVERTCAALGLAPAQVLCVGDSENDALAAHAAGCQIVLVSYGYNHGIPVREQRFAFGAVRVVDSLLELLS
jgi:phosphoglycolate phosphatase